MDCSKRIGKSIAVIIAIVTVFSFLAAYAEQGAAPLDIKDTSGAAFVNNSYVQIGMLTVSGNMAASTNFATLRDAGFGFELIPDVMELSKKSKIQIGMAQGYAVMLSYKTENETYINVFNIARIPKDDAAGIEVLDELKVEFPHLEIFAVLGDDTYYFSYNDDFSKFELSDSDKANLDLLVSRHEDLKNGVCVFPAVVEETVKEVVDTDAINMNDFSAITLGGEEYTNAELAKYDLTVVNVWATWCAPCIEEMPELEKLYGMVPANVNFITVCSDSNEEFDLATRIMTELKLTFPALVPDDKLQASLLDHVMAYPTTLFFDSEGNIVGDPQIGAPVGGSVSEAYLSIITERLNEVVSGK
ncbi:MAG: TlpA family protein disulfide reductase [Oscillospiraceae bacterium]|jgi:thiol-disulfide isomerase/thioredoxin|nr:TlpA family protein disulfide reductase [Oscillospiraceae bacterium]